ncbi:hypothetical protein SDC9_165832 [bioreactor metagenome]|uniref:Uncharacterized protein n=1 Tax=bioreactor metagenome TaxID=1076179 RepID=A0A645FXN4_9ZZZZ
MYSDIINIAIDGENHIQFCMASQKDEQNLVSHYPTLLNEYDKSLMHGIAPCFTSHLKTASVDFLYSYQAHVGGQYFVLQTPVLINGTTQQQLISQPLIDFAALHILSEQVRYRQDRWRTILLGEEKAIIGLIEIYINTVSRRFPNAIINALFNEEFTFGMPAMFQ